MAKTISAVKVKDAIKLDGFIVSPYALSETDISIIRIKQDPGAAYINISTTGGEIAVLRYAYEGKALKNMTKVSEGEMYHIKTGHDTIKVAIGNYMHDPKAENGVEAMFDDIFAILETSRYTMTPHTEDGFMMLVRKHPRYSGPDAPEKNESYDADITVQCKNIREKDEEIIALISAINLWGNRVGVHFNAYYDSYDDEIGATIARALYSNPGIVDIFRRMEGMQMVPKVLDMMSASLVRMLKPVGERIPNWTAFGASCRPLDKDDDDDIF